MITSSKIDKIEFNAQIISNSMIMEINRQKSEWARARQPKVVAQPVIAKKIEVDPRKVELWNKYPTVTFDSLSKKQVDAARKFAAKFNTSVSQASKYINACFAHLRNEISDADLKTLTGWSF